MLEVHEVEKGEVFSDVVRIHESRRGGRRAGRVYRIKIGRRTKHAVVRGLKDEQAGWIRLDEALRDKLGVKPGDMVDPKLSRAGLFGWLAYMINASEPAVRAASWISIVSLGLGVLSIFLSIDSSAVIERVTRIAGDVLALAQEARTTSNAS
jgi:hypothetical protein